MFPFFETIRIVNAEVAYLRWHQARMEKTLAHHYPSHNLPPLEVMLKDIIHKTPEASEKILEGIIKCRLFYNNIKWKTEFVRYTPKTVLKLRMVHDNDIDYSYKYSDRKTLEELFALRGTADDVLIVKNGLITDTSIANIILWDGKHFHTPANPLLRGTCRERLLASGTIAEANISIGDLTKYTHFMLINAMNDFNSKRWLPIENILQSPFHVTDNNLENGKRD